MVEKAVIYPIIIFCACVLVVSLYLIRRRARCSAVIVLIPLSLLAIIVGGYLFWYVARPLPTDVQRILFNGIDYAREVRPGPVIIHVVKINLHAEGIHFLVTPHTSTEGWELKGRTVSQFLDEFGVQVAINGDFFDPWRDYGFWDFYPHMGDGVNVRGLTASLGDVYTSGYTPPEHYATLYISRDNQASFNYPIGSIYNAISGNMMLIVDGVPTPVEGADDYLMQPHPRTAVALDITGQILMLFVIDGRQPNYSEGVTIPELQITIASYGGYNALSLDGGGSTTLVIQDENGEASVLNSPIHNRIPGRERPVANHLGIYAEPITNGN